MVEVGGKGEKAEEVAVPRGRQRAREDLEREKHLGKGKSAQTNVVQSSE